MIDIQTVLTYLTLVSIPVGILYYIMTLRNAEKTRKFQTLKQLSDWLNSEEFYYKYFEINNAEWDDLEDFYNKYDSSVNIDMASKRMSLLQSTNILGKMVREGLVDRDIIWDWGGRGIIMTWEKYSEVIIGNRKRFYLGDSSYLGDFEYLYDEMIKERNHRGITQQ